MREKGISGSTLKMVAVVTMLIDHTAAVLLARILLADGTALHEGMLLVYNIMRMIGRIAFPIFCFLLVEGFLHTRAPRKYALRLGLFALISEIPFDLAFHAELLEGSYQNVFFTLWIGLLTMMGFAAIERHAEWKMGLRTVLYAAAVCAGMAAAELFGCDYGALGVMCILILYLFRRDRKQQILAGCLAFVWWEWPAVFAFLPVYFYNGKRGWRLKYLFYIFYPAHLLVLYGIACAIGYGAVSVV